nr:hypothetical protein HK105_002154 [Polyrhizophydium stewartii]
MTSHPYSDPPYHHAQPSPSYHDPHHAHMRHHLPPPQSHSYHPSPHAHHQPHHAIYTSSPAPFDPMLASRPPALAPLSAPVPILSNPPLPISSSASSSSAAASPSASSVPHVLASSSSTSEYGAIHSPTTPIQHSSQSLHNTAVHQHSQQRRNFHMFPYMQQSLPPQPLSAHAMTVPSFLFNMPHLNSPHIKTEMPPLSAPTDSIMSPLVYDVSDVML